MDTEPAWGPREPGGDRFSAKAQRDDLPGASGRADDCGGVTSWPQVSRPVHTGGLGFGLKWDMGWMHDTLRYLKRNPAHRKYHPNELSFRMVSAFHENLHT